MLFKTIHKVAAATALWAMALLGASLANAEIIFSPGQGEKTGTLVFSKEGLVTMAGREKTGTGGAPGFYAINSATTTLMTAAKTLPRLTVYHLRQADPIDNTVWLRVEGDGDVLKLFAAPQVIVTGGAWKSIPSNVGLSDDEAGVFLYEIDPDESPLFDGTTFPTEYGSADPPKVSIRLGTVPGGAIDMTDPDDPQFRLDAAPTRIKQGAGQLMVSGYETGPQAFTGGEEGRLFMDSVVATRTASSLGVTFMEGTTAIADVETGFTKFLGSTPNSATLGSVNVGLAATATNHLFPNGEKVLASNVGMLIGGDSMVQVTSDTGFAFANFTLGGSALMPIATTGGTLHEDASCADPNPDMGSNAMENVCKVALKAGMSELKAAVITPKEGEDAATIPASEFSATVMFDDESTAMKAVLPADAGPSVIGNIEQNGATYQLPMVTTFEGYNNRIVIVNRGKRPASYSMTFTTEDDVEATAGSAATGMVGAESAMVVRTMDAVSLEGGARTAATLFIVGAPGNLDVLTQIVNKSDGSTDTLRYDADQAR